MFHLAVFRLNSMCMCTSPYCWRSSYFQKYKKSENKAFKRHTQFVSSGERGEPLKLIKLKYVFILLLSFLLFTDILKPWVFNK